jgi:hypothetical protein
MNGPNPSELDMMLTRNYQDKTYVCVDTNAIHVDVYEKEAVGRPTRTTVLQSMYDGWVARSFVVRLCICLVLFGLFGLVWFRFVWIGFVLFGSVWFHSGWFCLVRLSNQWTERPMEV